MLSSFDKFLLAAGNAEQFDDNVTIDVALKKLGLKDQYTPLPGMTITLLPHQIMGVAWMLGRFVLLYLSLGLLTC